MVINVVMAAFRHANYKREIYKYHSLLTVASDTLCQCRKVPATIYRSNVLGRYLTTLPKSSQLDTASSRMNATKESNLENENPLLKQRQPHKRLIEEPEETEPHIIYEGVLTKQLKHVKVFSLTTSAMGLVMQPILIQKSAEVPLAANIAIFGMIGFFTYVTPFLIHAISKKYVAEIIYNPQTDSYKATTFTFFLRRKEINFQIDDVIVPEVPGPFTTVTVKTANNKFSSIFFAPEAFLKPSHYGRMMGYDKPIDLGLTEDKSKTDTKAQK